MNIVYILQCSDNSLYIGWTNRFKNRIKAHNSGKGAKYTRGKRPVKPVLKIYCKNSFQARSLEMYLKQLNRKDKIRLLEDENYCQETIKKYTGEKLHSKSLFTGFQ